MLALGDRELRQIAHVCRQYPPAVRNQQLAVTSEGRAGRAMMALIP